MELAWAVGWSYQAGRYSSKVMRLSLLLVVVTAGQASHWQPRVSAPVLRAPTIIQMGFTPLQSSLCTTFGATRLSHVRTGRVVVSRKNGPFVVAAH